MRKDYVKPTMESEEFVANEYVAACWVMNCECTEDGMIVGGPDITSLDALRSDMGIYTTQSGDANIYIGTINGSVSCPDASSDEHTNTEYRKSINFWIYLYNYTLGNLFGKMDLIQADLTDHHHVTLSSYTAKPNASC